MSRTDFGAVDGFFAKMCGTSMLSMFENTKEKVTVHIMHNDRLTPDNRGKLCYIAGQYGQQVEFHNVEEIAGDTLRKFEAVHPIASGINAAWYPLLSHEVFPDLDKIILLGADVIFNLDVAELWACNLEGYGIATVSEIYTKGPNEVNPIVKTDMLSTSTILTRTSYLQDRVFSEKILMPYSTRASSFTTKNILSLNKML